MWRKRGKGRKAEAPWGCPLRGCWRVTGLKLGSKSGLGRRPRGSAPRVRDGPDRARVALHRGTLGPVGGRTEGAWAWAGAGAHFSPLPQKVELNSWRNTAAG